MATIDEMFLNSKKVKHDIHEHMEILAAYAQDKTVVELGVRTGNSTLAFLRGRPKWLKSYDIIILDNAKIIEAQAKAEGFHFELEEADDLKIEIPFCDILFIDTEHNGDQILKELNLHGKHAQKYIIMHDTISFGLFPEKQNEVYRGMMFGIIPWLITNPDWKVKDHFTNNHGLLILEKK